MSPFHLTSLGTKGAMCYRCFGDGHAVQVSNIEATQVLKQGVSAFDVSKPIPRDRDQRTLADGAAETWH